MVDQYPFEGFTDRYPDTRPTPDWFGFGLKHREMRSSPVKHIVYADGQRQAVIEVRHDDNGPMTNRIMDKIKGREAETPQLSIATAFSFWRAPKREPKGEEPMFQFPDTRPGKLVNDGGWGI